MLQRGAADLMEFRNEVSGEEAQEEKKIKVKKSKVPKGSAQEYMAYLNSQKSARAGI